MEKNKLHFNLQSSSEANEIKRKTAFHYSWHPCVLNCGFNAVVEKQIQQNNTAADSQSAKRRLSKAVRKHLDKMPLDLCIIANNQNTSHSIIMVIFSKTATSLQEKYHPLCC